MKGQSLMSGQTDLSLLLSTLTPVLNAGIYVFCTLTKAPPVGLQPLLTFQETEGLTVIVREKDAHQYQLDGLFPSAWITLTVHSSLAAVGLTAAVAGALAEAGISCNVVAAFYHDHLFVPVADGERAMSVLEALVSRTHAEQ
jgi:hypothetical protein